MKRYLSICLILMGVIIFSGCGNFEVKVETPSVKVPIEGQWKIEEINEVYQSEDEKDELIDTTISFGKNEVILFDKIYKNISYKAKIVDLDEYLYNMLGYLPENTPRDDTSIEVITISSDNTFIKDIMLFNKNIFIIDENRLLKLKRVDKTPIDIINTSNGSGEKDSYYDLDSGVLLGLSSEGDDGTEYRTLWIYLENDDIRVKEINNILLPRKSGFSIVSNKREYNKDNYFKDTIVFKDMNGKETNFIYDTSKELEENIDKDITFIGNDYMSTRTSIYNKTMESEKLNTYIIDINTLENNKSISLGALTNSANINNVILPQDGENQVHGQDIKKFTNFGIKRKQGRWGFYTLDGSTKNESTNNSEDELKKMRTIEITLRVSENIARYDEIFIPWQAIQKQVPSAEDAISSPNKNLAVIKTKYNLYMYKIVDNELDENSVVSVPLWGRESIIMAEWALGDFVRYWTEQVDSLKPIYLN